MKRDLFLALSLTPLFIGKVETSLLGASFSCACSSFFFVNSEKWRIFSSVSREHNHITQKLTFLPHNF